MRFRRKFNSVRLFIFVRLFTLVIWFFVKFRIRSFVKWFRFLIKEIWKYIYNIIKINYNLNYKFISIFSVFNV